MPSLYTVTAQSGEQPRAVANCQVGDPVTGGGYYNENGVPAVANHPNSTGDGWVVDLSTPRGTVVGFAPFQAYAICADITP